MRNIFSFDCRENVRHVVKKALKEDFGIKVPKEKPVKLQANESCSSDSKVFGIPLENVSSENVSDDCYCPIPRFLIDAVAFLEPYLKTEGLFRKSGSLSRQKTIRQQVENGGSCNIEIAQPHDIASIIKQFLRELPDSVMKASLHSTFIKCLQLNTPNEQITSILMTCLLLPDTNLRVLQYLCQFVAKVAIHSKESKMTLNNLAIILSPNLMFTNKDKDNDKYVKEQTEIVDILLQNANSIGMVKDEIVERVDAMERETCSMSTSSADELEAAAVDRQRRSRRRSRSISGFVNGIGRKIKGANNTAGCATGNDEDVVEQRRIRHRRSKSDKNVDVEKLIERNARNEFADRPTELCINSPYPRPGLRSLKRRAGVHRTIGQTPNRKSPKLSRRAESCQMISSPTLLSMPTQFLLASKSSFIPIMRSQEDVRKFEDSKILAVGKHTETGISPNVSSSSFSLNFDLANDDVLNEENISHSRKYSVIRDKYFNSYLRNASIKNPNSPSPVLRNMPMNSPCINSKVTAKSQKIERDNSMEDD